MRHLTPRPTAPSVGTRPAGARFPNHRARGSPDGVQGRPPILAEATEELATAFGSVDAIVFTAGSNGGSVEDTKAIDGNGVTKAIEAAHHAGVSHFVLVSVLPESWRERDLGSEVEYHFAVKKETDIALTRSDLDWLVLRPSLLVDDPGTGTVSLGPAEFHGQMSRADVAETLAELLHEPRIGRQILELNTGTVPIRDAVKANVRRPWTRQPPITTDPADECLHNGHGTGVGVPFPIPAREIMLRSTGRHLGPAQFPA
ncbi:NAD(P)H-binding protein [Streptomyces sp. MBT27]|uniref:NAD(P)H-binding protein n=1 Tax=Streptomyces sp. MBT27 TaxID=1488356 RepID=UPI00142204FB|nr:NAD(P)H-binding protein [Streptomyces sp. MBT27]